MAKFSVSIPTALTPSLTRPYTAYSVEVRLDNGNSYSKITTPIRYNNFWNLNVQLGKELPEDMAQIQFPPKDVFGRFADNVVEFRRRELEKWLQFCFEKNKILRNPSFQHFLKIEHLKDKIETFIIARDILGEEEFEDDDGEVFKRPVSGQELKELAPGASIDAGTYADSRVRVARPSQSSRRGLSSVSGERPVSLVVPEGAEIDPPPAPPNSLARSTASASRGRGPPPPPPESGENYKALYAYDDGKLRFKPGDVISITKKSEDSFSWWEGWANGVFGELPANYLGPLTLAVEVQANAPAEGVAMFDYAPESDKQIPLTFGDILELHSRDQEGEWWFGCVIGTSKWGFFPRNFVRQLDPTDYVSLDDGTRVPRDDITNFNFDFDSLCYVYNSDAGTRSNVPIGGTNLDATLAQEKADAQEKAALAAAGKSKAGAAAQPKGLQFESSVPSGISSAVASSYRRPNDKRAPKPGAQFLSQRPSKAAPMLPLDQTYL